MSVNVLGGSLEFNAVLTTDSLEQGNAALQAQIDKLVQAYEKLTNAGVDIPNNLQNASEQAKIFGALMVHVAQQTGEALNPDQVKKYAAAFTLVNETIKPLVATLAQNVGPDKIDALAKSLEGVDDDAKALQITLNFIKDNIGSLNLNPEAAQALNTAIEQLEQTFSGLSSQSDNFATKTASAFSQLRALKNELATTDRNDPAFGKELKAAEELENKIRNVNKTLELTGKNTAGFAALGEAVKAVIGGFEAWNGILGLTSQDTEQMERTIKNVVAAMGILNGIQEVAAVLDKRSELNVFLLEQARKLTAKATEEQAVATGALVETQAAEIATTEGAAVAQEELNVAMAANPAAILLIAITGIVLALQTFISSSKVAAEEQTAMNEALSEATEIYNKLIELQKSYLEDHTKAANDAVALAQAQGKPEQDILDLRLKALAAKKQENDLVLASQQLTAVDVKDQQERYESIKNQIAELNKIQLVQKGLLFPDQQKELDKLLKAKEELEKPVNVTQGAAGVSDEQVKQRINLLKEQLKTLEQQEAAYTRMQVLGEKLNDTQQAKLKGIQADIKTVQSQLSATSAAFNSNQDADAQTDQLKAQKAKLLHDQALQSAAAQADANVLLAQKGSQAELDAEIVAIHARAKEELETENKTAGEKAKIRAQELVDVKEVELKKSLLVLSNQKSDLKTQLDLVKQGSAEELSLKLQLLQNEADAEILQARGNDATIRQINADRAKAQSDLQKKFALESSETDVETVIAGLNTRLAAVQKGSEEELSIKKQLVDQETALEILRDQGRITNEALLQATILEINSDANVKKKKLDDDYYDHLLELQLKSIDKQTEAANAQYQKIINSPLSTPIQVYEAKKQEIQNDIAATQREIAAVTAAIFLQRGSVSKLNLDLDTLSAKLAKLKADASNIDDAELLRKQKTIISDFSSIAGGLQNMSSALQGIDANAAHVLGSLSKVADLGAKVGNAALAYSTGNMLGVVTSSIGAISDIISMFSGDEITVTAQQIDEMKNQLIIGEIEITRQYEQRLLDQAKLNKLRIQGIQEETKLLQQQAQTTQQQFDSLFAEIQKEKGQALKDFTIGGITAQLPQEFSLAGLTYDQLNDLFLKGELSDKAKELFEELQKLKDAGADITQQLADAKDQLDQTFTGTTADDISDSIIDGFKNGLRSAADFADTFQQLMQNAILNALKYQVLEQPLQDFYNQFAIDAESDSILTADEINQLKNNFNAIIANAGEKFSELKQITDIDFSGGSTSANSLAGAIKGITADQAELLAGQFGGLRLTAMDQLNMATRQFQVLQDIRRDTSNLPEMRDILRFFKLNGIRIIA